MVSPVEEVAVASALALRVTLVLQEVTVQAVINIVLTATVALPPEATATLVELTPTVAPTWSATPALTPAKAPPATCVRLILSALLPTRTA